MTVITKQALQSLPAHYSLRWCMQGWQLMRKSPFKLFLVLFVPLFMEGILQLIPAPYGVLISKWTMAIAAAAIWPVLQYLSAHERFSLKAIKTTGWHKMCGLATFIVFPFLLQLWIAFMLLGDNGVSLLLFMDTVEVTQWQLGLIFASATPILMLLQFAPARILLANESISTALRQSFSAFVFAWRPLLVIAIIKASVIFLVPYTFLLSALLTAPWLAAVVFQAHREIFAE